MKKIILGALIIILVFGIGGCGKIKEDNKNKGDAPVKKIDMAGRNVAELYFAENCYEEKLPEINVACDMDMDGKDDNIRVTVTNEGGNGGSATAFLEINEAKSDNLLDSSYAADIEGIYLVNLNSEGDRKAIAFVESEEDVFKSIILCQYSDNAVSRISFNDGDTTEDNLRFKQRDYHSNAFDVNDNGEIILEQITNSRGNWEVKKTYRLNSDNVVELVKQDAYDVVPQSNMSSEDGGRWIVNETITDRGLVLNKGDRIKVLSDDCNNKILIQKSNGEEGWFTMKSNNDDELLKVSDMFIIGG